MTGRIKKANKQRELDALVFGVLVSFSALQWNDWLFLRFAAPALPSSGALNFLLVCETPIDCQFAIFCAPIHVL
jgi:hypothetical protein